MPLIRSLVFKYLAHHSKLIAVILLLNEIMPTYSHYIEKGLVYITIITLFSCQLSSCFKYMKLNIHSSCNIHFISNTKCIYFTVHLYTL
jgi:hypothetical protein